MSAIGEQRSSTRYMTGANRPTKGTLNRLLKTLRPYAHKLYIALSLMVLGTLIGLVPPLILRDIIDVAIFRRSIYTLMFMSGVLVVLPAAGSVISIGQNYLSTSVAQTLIHDLRISMYKHAQRLGIDFYAQTSGGEIHSRIVNDLNGTQQVIQSMFSGIVVNTISIALTLSIMFFLNWQLALLSMLVLPGFAMPVISFGRRSYSAVTRTQEALSRLTGHLEEVLTLSGLLVVKSFGTQKHELLHFEELSRELQGAVVKQSMVGQWFSFLASVVASIGLAAVYGYGGYLCIIGKVQIGTIVAFASYLGRLYSPASSLAGINTIVLGGLALFDRIFHFLDEPIASSETNTAYAHVTPSLAGPIGIEYKDVHFSYRQNEKVLHGVSFLARPGELTAIVGPSGAGKSTVLSLGARFYDPEIGEVCLSGVSLKDVPAKTLRETISVVPQDVFLFHSTLEENICYGWPDASAEDVERAVRASQLHDFVKALPLGLQTVVGEHGYRLSGGEKQRVAIARAILHNPKVLLLDEATSALDSHAERLMQKALARLFAGRTVIAVAHRLSTIRVADQILVIDQGRIVESGQHRDLLMRNGVYAQLYREQFYSAVPHARHKLDG